jgi:3-isopropylmalate dehydrogenase
LNENNFGMYEPIHGSAPDIAGQGCANPLATILSVAMMLRYSLGHQQSADILEQAVIATLRDGLRTQDIAKPDEMAVSTAQMGAAVIQRLQTLLAA